MKCLYVFQCPNLMRVKTCDRSADAVFAGSTNAFPHGLDVAAGMLRDEYMMANSAVSKWIAGLAP
jgi:hypothetical protein